MMILSGRYTMLLEPRATPRARQFAAFECYIPVTYCEGNCRATNSLILPQSFADGYGMRKAAGGMTSVWRGAASDVYSLPGLHADAQSRKNNRAVSLWRGIVESASILVTSTHRSKPEKGPQSGNPWPV